MLHRSGEGQRPVAAGRFRRGVGHRRADLELGVGFNGTSGAFSYEAYSPDGTDLGQFEVGVASSSSWGPHDDGASAHFITTLPGLTMNTHTHNSKYVVDLG